MWFNPGGNEMSDEEWASSLVRCLGVLLSGDTIDVLNFEGTPIRDDTFLLLINAHFESIQFVLPGQEHIEWELILDTVHNEGFSREPQKFTSGNDIELSGRATSLLKLIAGTQAQARQESWKKRHVELPHDRQITGQQRDTPIGAKTKSASQS